MIFTILLHFQIKPKHFEGNLHSYAQCNSELDCSFICNYLVSNKNKFHSVQDINFYFFIFLNLLIL